MSGRSTCLCDRCLYFIHIIPNGFWQDPSSNQNGVGEILQEVRPVNNSYRPPEYFRALYSFPLINLTAFRFSAGPETRYALLTNLATVSMFMKPFHRISCLAKNCDVSSTDGGSEATDLKHTSIKPFIGVWMQHRCVCWHHGH